MIQNRILYEIIKNDNLKIIPQSTMGKILQGLTTQVQTRLQSAENKKRGKSLIEKILSPGLDYVLNEFFKHNQNKFETKKALLTDKKLITNDQDLLCDNNLIYLCYEGLEQFLKKVKNDNGTPSDYRKKLARNIRGSIHNKMTSQALEGGKILWHYQHQSIAETNITRDILTMIQTQEREFQHNYNRKKPVQALMDWLPENEYHSVCCQILTSIHSHYMQYMDKLERDTIFVQYFVIGRLSNNRNYNQEDDILSYYDTATEHHPQGFQWIEKVSAFLLHLDKKKDVQRIRNYIHNATLLTQDRMNGDIPLNKSFMDSFNDVRSLMSYDRKTLNSLPVIFKNTLKKYQVDIRFGFKGTGKNRDGLDLVIKSLNSDIYDMNFIEQLTELLKYNPHKGKLIIDI